jgi:hypothetical protein
MENLSFRIDKKITPIQTGKNKYRFAIDKTGATDINITQDKIEDVIYSVFQATDDLDLVTILTNIKGKQKIPKIFLKGIGSDYALITSQGCGFHDTTTLVLQDVDIEVEQQEIGLELCLNDFVNTTLEVYISDGGLNESITIEDAILAYLTELLKENIQRFTFDETTATAGIFSKIIDNTVTPFTPVGSNPTATDILTQMYSALPFSWKKSQKANPVIFISPGFMDMVISEVTHSTAPVMANIEVIDDRFRLPMTKALVVVSQYLSGVKAISGISNYLFLATDLQSDFENIRVWYSQDNGTIRFQAKPYLGTAIADIDNYVYYEGV